VSPVLETQGLSKSFGGISAADGVSLTLAQGARHALIGPNGAGKTTLVNLLTGALAPDAGRILIDGRDVTTMPQHRRVKLGVARTFQVSQLFPDMTPLESVALALAERLGVAWTWWRGLGREDAVFREAASLLDEAGLLDCAEEPTRSLPYGRQRLTEIALALALKPRLLLLDEPAAGVPQGESAELFRRISALPRDVTVLLIEHDMDIVFRFAERITVMVNGAVLTEDAPGRVAADPRVREVYLGHGAAEGARHG
jgi:branched-chain amino acid transport system ATP-binding protein